MNKIVSLIIILLGFVQIISAQLELKEFTEGYNYLAKLTIIEVSNSQTGIYTIEQENKNYSGTDSAKNNESINLIQPNQSIWISFIEWIIKVIILLIAFLLGRMYNEFFNKRKIKSVFDKNKTITEERDRLLKEIFQLSKEIRELKLSSQREYKPSEGVKVGQNTVPKLLIEKEPVVFTSLFFKIPELDGSFKSFDADTAQNDHHYFKIQFKEEENTGELFYLSSDYDLEAIDDLDSFLKPVAKVENASGRSGTRIQQSKTGIVIRSSDRWQIDPNNKLEVKLY